MPQARRKYKVLLFEEPDGRYSVEVPELPGCYSAGDTREEALRNAREAIECHLDPPTSAVTRKLLVEEVEV
jgi:predicted RNase H-like HicB family nuclease